VIALLDNVRSLPRTEKTLLFFFMIHLNQFPLPEVERHQTTVRKEFHPPGRRWLEILTDKKKVGRRSGQSESFPEGPSHILDELLRGKFFNEPAFSGYRWKVGYSN